MEVGHKGLLAAILEHDRDVNEHFGLEAFQLAEPKGPLLHVACAKGRQEIANILIAHGAKVTERNAYNETPMIIACRLKYDPIINDLIRAGSDVEHAIGYYQAKASKITTILDYATRWKLYQTVTERLPSEGFGDYHYP